MTEDKYPDVYFAASLELKIDRIGGDGYILDVGGGGEGVIGQLEGSRVVAIDKRKDELEEASIGEYLRIIMDATDLKFLDSSFSLATSFFSMMYMDTDTKQKVFKEVYRILKSDGELLLWDLTVPDQFDTSKRVYAIMLKIHLPDRVIETGYGCPWARRTQDIEMSKKMASDIGFEVVEESVKDVTFFLRLRKTT